MERAPERLHKPAALWGPQSHFLANEKKESIQ